jgi:hypothetical protein
MPGLNPKDYEGEEDSEKKTEKIQTSPLPLRHVLLAIQDAAVIRVIVAPILKGNLQKGIPRSMATPVTPMGIALRARRALLDPQDLKVQAEQSEDLAHPTTLSEDLDATPLNTADNPLIMRIAHLRYWQVGVIALAKALEAKAICVAAISQWSLLIQTDNPPLPSSLRFYKVSAPPL